MKNLLFIFLYLTTFSTVGQTWQKLEADNFAMNYAINAGFAKPPYNQRHFKINPYDNTIWMSNNWLANNFIRRIDNNGNLTYHDNGNVPVFGAGDVFTDFEFTPSNVFVIAENAGLYEFDGLNWSLTTSVQDGTQISSDGDTIWMCNTTGLGYYKIAAGISSWGSYPNGRMVSKNGIIWMSPNYFGKLGRMDEGGTPNYYGVDTTILSSYFNFDFKFSPNTDTLYTGTGTGIFLAHDDVFFDSITPGNTLNMPDTSVWEFEIDSQDNIWAIFKKQTEAVPNFLAFYDHVLQEWTQVYDATNSPLPFDVNFTIELDTADNLWVAASEDLYVLKINNWPGWLEHQELDKSNEIAIYPNPTSNGVKIELPILLDAPILITDLAGNAVKQIDSNGLSVECDLSDLSNGVYLVNVELNGAQFVKRIIIQK